MNQHDEASQVAVVYLSYLPYGIEPLQSFIGSLQQFDAGKTYIFYIIFKDGSNKEIDEAKAWLEESKIQYSELKFNGGLDINAYLYAATQIEAPYLLFFNSRTRVLNDYWLLYFFNALHFNQHIAAASATGSWQSYYRSARRIAFKALRSKGSVSHYFNMLKLAAKTLILYKRWFPPFPNPHFRTNAFIIRRELLFQLKPLPIMQKKNQAYRFESGIDSLTRQLINMGWQVCIVDKNGKIYLPGQWDKSNTFWINQQEDLLVSDNQTQQYAIADTAGKTNMTNDAWNG